jgi:diaminopimelate decarboxylase
MICDNLSVGANGHLLFAGQDTVELANRYGTPLYLMDEQKIRERVRIYKTAMAEFFPAGSVPEFASKAFSCRRIYQIMAEEGVDIDAVSPGELYTAVQAGFPMENCFFHGNNKSDEDIAMAMDNGVGWFVVDSFDEIEAVEHHAAQRGIIQNVLLRVTPGIDPHTHQKINTGTVDSKFGIALETGQAMEAVERLLQCPHLQLHGFHCHVGSQLFDVSLFRDAAQIMLTFVRDVRDRLGYTADTLNLGGGLGVRYVESDPVIDYREKLREIAGYIRSNCEQLGLAVPRIHLEPGRSLVADAGLTLYTVGSVKEVTGYKTYVSVNGGMTDNPRYTLYGSPYTVINASHGDKPADCTVTLAGRCCESGDILQEDVPLARPRRGDIVAVLTTGAYNYSMASNYNRVPRPPVVMLKDGDSYVAVRRETYADLCALDE